MFPAIRKMEAEVVAMTLELFHGEKGRAAGCMTSGGTESILVAMRAYRDIGRQERGITEPELVVPDTAHAAFDKACDYFGIKLVHVPVDQQTFKVDPEAVRRAITRNTVGIVCSAPSFPQGVIDPIQEVAAIAKSRNIPMHVDCCLGSFVVALSTEAGFPLAPFDFRVPGVTSISADTHKFGFAPKGSSVIMYSDVKYRHAQYFVAPSWTGGIYASPSVAGSRSGAIIAACWATLVHIGRNGYRESARKILNAAVEVEAAVQRVAKATGNVLELYGQRDLCVVAFGPNRSGTNSRGKVNIYQVGDAMGRRGWHLNTLQYPASIHICVTYANADRACSDFERDLLDSVNEVLTAAPNSLPEGSGGIYGMAASIPDKSLVAQVAHTFLDTLYKV
jgi:sphinganine-1-phosphate aldolase